MRSWKLALFFGFLLWLIPFVVSILIFPLHETERPFFETIMPVVLTLSVVIFGVIYLRRLDMGVMGESVKLGFLWLAISLFIDFFMFSAGPMQMPFVEYMKDIGLTYLIFPIVTIGFGYLLRQETGEAILQTS